MAINNMVDVSNISYCGKEGQEIFSKDIYDIDLRQYGITFLDGLKGKQKIYTGEISDVYQLYTCPFTPQGSASLAEAYIEPSAIKVNLESCYDNFWNTWLVESTAISLQGQIPPTFADWYFAKLRKEMQKEYQDLWWRGDTGYTGSSKVYLKTIDGIEKQLHENTGVTKVSGASFTVDNAISQVEAIIMKGLEVANNAEVDTEGYKLFMNHNDLRVLEVALGKQCCPNSTNQVFANWGRENGRIYVMGFEIVPSMVSKGKMIFGPARNLFLGFDSYDARIEYKLIDMRETTGDNAFRVIALTNIAAAILFPELFVLSE